MEVHHYRKCPGKIICVLGNLEALISDTRGPGHPRCVRGGALPPGDRPRRRLRRVRRARTGTGDVIFHETTRPREEAVRGLSFATWPERRPESLTLDELLDVAAGRVGLIWISRARLRNGGRSDDARPVRLDEFIIHLRVAWRSGPSKRRPAGTGWAIHGDDLTRVGSWRKCASACGSFSATIYRAITRGLLRRPQDVAASARFATASASHSGVGLDC